MVDDCAHTATPQGPSRQRQLGAAISPGLARERQSRTHVLPPELLLDDGIRHVPAGDALSELGRLLRVVGNGLLRRGLFEPEVARDLLRLPERMHYARDERKRGRSGPSLAVRDNLLDEPPVFRRLTIIERRVLDNLTCGEPDQGLRTEKASREVEVDLIWEAVGEDFMKVGGNVCCSGMVRVVVRMPVWGRGRDCKR